MSAPTDEQPLVLEALLLAVNRDDRDSVLDQRLADQAARLAANAQQPHRLLVWDSQRDGGLQELELPELLDHYPCHGEQARWRPDDVVALLESKAHCWRQTMGALELLRHMPAAHPSAGTVLLLVPEPEHAPLELAALTISLSDSRARGRNGS